MANRTPGESQVHVGLVKMMATHFAAQGYRNVKADLAGYECPGQVNGYIPDVTCQKADGSMIVLEAETCSTIFDSHTESQWQAFARASAGLQLAVPRLCGMESGRAKAQRQLAQLGISSQITIWEPTG